MGEFLVRKVDHFFVVLDDLAVGSRFLTETLALPVMWPLEAAGSESMVGVGNANFELLPGARGRDRVWPPVSTRPARIGAVAFEPVPKDDALIAELDHRGIPHSQLYRGPGYTNVTFEAMIDRGDAPGSFVFACDYHHPWLVPTGRPPWPITDEARRAAALESVGGGVLGITAVAELQIGTRDLARSTRRWQNLFDPLPQAEPGVWQPEVGPAIRLVEAEDDCVLAPVFAVASMDKAKAALQQLDIAFEDAGSHSVFRPEELAGLELRLSADSPLGWATGRGQQRV